MANQDRFKSKLKSNYWHAAMWSAHQERANRKDRPAFLRLADLAIAHAEANGHAQFAAGELAKHLGLDYRVVNRAIDRAVEYGLLGKGSGLRCLQLPDRMFTTYAGDGTEDEKRARRLADCPTCTGTPRRPAECHPERERYTSADNGALCEPCYRKRTRTNRGK